MSASLYRRQLDSKRKQRVEAERKAGHYRTRETEKRTAASKARTAAGKSRSSSTAASKLREADRFEREAAAAGKEAGQWQKRASAYAKEELALQLKLAKAEQSEAAAAERRRNREELQAARRRAAEVAELRDRLEAADTTAKGALREPGGGAGDGALPLRWSTERHAPKAEKLRVLILGAASAGGLRIGREQTRIRRAVESALHRDRIDIDARLAATTDDLLDGMTKFRPHVVHFSGHSDHDLIEFEDEVDGHHDGVIVTARAFAKALAATDDLPLLVLLNSCNSASQIDALVERVVPFAIGMPDEIADGDAINYAAAFYAAVANGQSIRSAHALGQVALEFAGLVDDKELPRLAHADDIDPSTTFLVKASK